MEAGIGQDRGVDAASELAELVDRLSQTARRVVEPSCELGLVAGQRTRLFQADRDGGQVLLGAVVERALDPLPFGIPGRDQARPRGPQLGQLRR